MDENLIKICWKVRYLHQFYHPKLPNSYQKYDFFFQKMSVKSLCISKLMKITWEKWVHVMRHNELLNDIAERDSDSG